jgi:hypothetical protein
LQFYLQFQAESSKKEVVFVSLHSVSLFINNIVAFRYFHYSGLTGTDLPGPTGEQDSLIMEAFAKPKSPKPRALVSDNVNKVI